MKKLKITENQRKMLESKVNAKMTKEDLNIRPSLSPSFKVSKTFKDNTKGIDGVKTEGVGGQVQWRELVPHVHELIKQMYTKPSKEDMNPFWEENGVSWDEIIHLLSKLELIKSVKGGYRLAKIVENPAKAVKIVAKLIEKLINDKKAPIEAPVDEMNSDDIKKSFQQQLSQEPKKSGKSKAEILKKIADIRAAELKRREEENNRPIGEETIDEYGESGYYPAGAEHDPSAPWNQVDPEPKSRAKTRVMDVVWWSSDIALMKGEGKLWVYNVESADRDEYADYAAREETFYGRDEDGDPIVDYGDWEMDGDIIENYVNDNLKYLSRGKGLGDWENGVELVELDYELAQDLLSLAKYIAKRDPKDAEQLAKIVSSIQPMGEATTSSAMGDVPVGPMSTGKQFDSNVKDELGDMISEHDPEQAPYLEQLKSLFNDGNVTPQQWITYADDLEPIVMGLKDNENYKEIITKVVLMLRVSDILNNFNPNAIDGNEFLMNYVTIFNNAKEGLRQAIENEATLPIGEVTSTTTAGNYAYDAPAGDGSSFWTAGNKLNKKMKNEVTAREGKNAFKDTQWPDGHFVEFDKCTKLNNNKEAQKGGCSTGAVDNVVKTKSSKHSVISDSSIYEQVAKATGRTIEEVKAILNKKISKSK